MNKTALSNSAKLEIIKKVADIIDGRVYQNYSGRGMFGKNCVGIVCNDAYNCIEEAAALGLRGARTDNMGKDYIVYWENIVWEE